MLSLSCYQLLLLSQQQRANIQRDTIRKDADQELLKAGREEGLVKPLDKK